jgi:hypothetical protein
VAQIYDGFSASVIYGLESYGSYEEGETLDFIQDGISSSTANCCSTLLAAASVPDASTASGHIIEGALQASGRAGSRQGKDSTCRFVGASDLIVTDTTFIFAPAYVCVRDA